MSRNSITPSRARLTISLSVRISWPSVAGSAQLAVLPLMSSGAPLWVVWATALCVNLRFMIFSAQWRPYFGGYPFWQRVRLAYFTADLNYVLFMRRFPEPKAAPEQLPYVASIGAAAALLLVAWAVFIRLNRSAEELEPEAMQQAETSIYLGTYADETAALATT